MYFLSSSCCIQTKSRGEQNAQWYCSCAHLCHLLVLYSFRFSHLSPFQWQNFCALLFLSTAVFFLPHIISSFRSFAVFSLVRFFIFTIFHLLQLMFALFDYNLFTLLQKSCAFISYFHWKYGRMIAITILQYSDLLRRNKNELKNVHTKWTTKTGEHRLLSVTHRRLMQTAFSLLAFALFLQYNFFGISQRAIASPAQSVRFYLLSQDFVCWIFRKRCNFLVDHIKSKKKHGINEESQKQPAKKKNERKRREMLLDLEANVFALL